jgi:TRAP-type transport system small permease protein
MALAGKGEVARAISPLSLYQKGLEGIDRAVGVFLIVIMAVMVGMVTSQVFCRYVLNTSIDWVDEISRLCFVWSIFVAIPLALKRGGHICMEMVIARIPPLWRDGLYRAMSALSLGMMLLVAYEAWLLTLDNWDEMIPSTGLSGGLFFLAVAVGGFHTALHLFNILFMGEPQKAGIIE